MSVGVDCGDCVASQGFCSVDSRDCYSAGGLILFVGGISVPRAGCLWDPISVAECLLFGVAVGGWICFLWHLGALLGVGCLTSPDHSQMVWIVCLREEFRWSFFPWGWMVFKRFIQKSSLSSRRFLVSSLLRPLSFTCSMSTNRACWSKLCPGLAKCLSKGHPFVLFTSERWPLKLW